MGAAVGKARARGHARTAVVLVLSVLAFVLASLRGPTLGIHLVGVAHVGAAEDADEELELAVETSPERSLGLRSAHDDSLDSTPAPVARLFVLGATLRPSAASNRSSRATRALLERTRADLMVFLN